MKRVSEGTPNEVTLPLKRPAIKLIKCYVNHPEVLNNTNIEIVSV